MLTTLVIVLLAIPVSGLARYRLAGGIKGGSAKGSIHEEIIYQCITLYFTYQDKG